MSQPHQLAEQKSRMLQQYVDSVKRQIHHLNNEYWRYIQRTGKQPICLTQKSQAWDIYLKWNEYYVEKKDKDDFAGIPDISQNQNYQNKQAQVSITASEIDLFKNFSGLEWPDRELTVWNMRFSNKILHKLKTMGDKVFSVLEYIFCLQMGLMFDSEILDTGPIMYLAAFSKVIKGGQSILYAIVPERVPITTVVKNNETVTRFQFRQYLRIIDIVNSNDNRHKIGSYEAFQQYIQQDPDKWNPFIPGAFLNDQSQIRLNSNEEILDISNIIKSERNNKCGPHSMTFYYPLLDHSQSLTPLERKSFQIVQGRWVSDIEDSKFSFQITTNMKSVNRMIIEKCTSQESCEWLVKFLMRIPNFNLKLTEQEQLLVSTAGNILCLGRSGTGKTTSAVLRLFALEILFKIRSNLFFKDGKESIKDSRLSAEDAEAACSLHSVIVTASPVLTSEIRRFYTNLRKKIINELQKREKAKRAKEMQQQNQEAYVEEEKEINVLEVQENKEEQELEINDDEVLDAEEMEKNFNMPHSMIDMRNDHFPAFLSVKRLIYMIDGSLKRPFFARNLKNEIIGQDSQAEWHNEQKGVLMINNYYKIEQKENPKDIESDKFLNLSSSDSDEDYEQSQLEETQDEVRKQVVKSSLKKQKVQDGEKIVQEFAQEVDYEIFERKFWAQYGFKEKKIKPSTVWTEIYSVIKGSHNSCQFQNLCIPLETYKQMASRRNSLSTQEIESIYKYFELYERWKKMTKGFDFMDIVNHNLREIQGLKYFGVPIHFMLVDEVQDLTAATIKLLLKVTDWNVFFAGDTAQTIAKGVGFRFCDLKNMLNLSDFEAPKVLQLTTNFRSHNKILTLANSIISAIELLFPLTIDKLHKEKSPVDGLKPIVLDSNLLDSLFYILLGKQSSLTNTTSSLLKQEGRADFGCDQVIIVRDQESKKKVPSILQHALCLTVYEAKGLEFDDVVVYNFFTDSQIKDQWKLLNFIQIKEVKVKVQNEKKMQDLDELNYEIVKEKEEDKDNEMNDEFESQFQFEINSRNENFQKEYQSLCTELKQLYVCCTRPKKRLIFYDEDEEAREVMMRFWSKIRAIDIVDEKMLNQKLDNEPELSEEQRQLLSKIAQSIQTEDQDQTHMEESKKKGWKIQGIKMFKRRFYEQAMKCFQHSGDKDLQQRAYAYNLAEEAAKNNSEKESLNYKLQEFSSQMSRQERKQTKQKITELQQTSLEQFQQASKVFIEINLKKQAAQCLFSAGMFEQAGLVFEEIQFYSQAAESYYILKDYSRAARLFNEGKMVTRAVECYKKLQNWDAILNVIQSNGDEFTIEQREELIFKYVPLALNSLYSLITDDQHTDNQEDGEEDEQMKENIEETKEQIVEVESEQEEDSPEKEKSIIPSIEETDKSISLINISEPKIEQENIKKSEIKKSNIKQQEKQKQNESEMFSIISESDVQSVQDNDKFGDSFEHLSQFDPEDEFLKSRTVSIMESVISGDFKNSDRKSVLSDYSILDVPENANHLLKEQLLLNLNIIKTKRDIYAEDIMMTKIIHYISQFNKEVKSYLSKLRSKEALLSQKPLNQENISDNQINTCTDEYQMELMFDLEQIDTQFLNILLDSLENFELYKLCLIVCNRYQLTERIGRYLVSIAHKYSNLQQVSTKFITLYHSGHKEVQQQVSFIGHQALHSALELIDPKYLSIKQGQLEGNLGQYCYTALMNLGFWKKLLFLMDLKSGLSIASMFADFSSFRQIYLGFYDKAEKFDSETKIQKALYQNSFEFLANEEFPKDDIQVFAYKTALDSIVWEHNNQPLKNLGIKFPSFFRLTELALMIQKKQASSSEFETLIDEIETKLFKLFNSFKLTDQSPYVEQCMSYDTFVSTFLLIQSAFTQTLGVKLDITTLPITYQQKFLKILHRILNLLQGQDLQKSQSNFQSMIGAMLSVLRVRQIHLCPALYDNYGENTILHYTSPLSQELTQEVELRKQKISEQITKQVFEQFNIMFTSRKEINRQVKHELRAAFQREQRDQLIEIIDLEANFLKVPYKLVKEKVVHKITRYLKIQSEKILSGVKLISKRKEVDKFETPFDILDSQETIIELYESSLLIQKMNKQVGSYGTQLQILNSERKFGESHDPVQFYLQQENEKKREKQIEHQKYLLELGLISKNYHDRQIKKILNRNNKSKQLYQSQIKYIYNITQLTLLNLQPIKIEKNARAIMIELAQAYWIFFNSTRDQEKVNINPAIKSLTMFTLTNNYVLFLEMMQKHIKNTDVEYKMLYQLMDYHVFQQAGDLLNSSKSLIDFVNSTQNENVVVTVGYCVNFLERAAIELLSIKAKDIYVPYELLRCFNGYFVDMEDENYQAFMDQVKQYNDADEEFNGFTLKLLNKKFKLSKDQVQYSGLIKRVIELIENQLHNTKNNHDNFHLFLLLATLIVNEPQICQNNKNKCDVIFKLLQEYYIINQDHPILEYTSYTQLVNDFVQGDFNEQSQLLYSDIRDDLQSCFVKVQIQTNNPSELEKQVGINLDQADLKEKLDLLKHKRLARLVKNLRKNQKLVQRNEKLKVGLNLEEIMIIQSIDPNSLNLDHYNQYVLNLMKECVNLTKFIRAVTVHTQYENVIDLHYLLTQKDKISVELMPQLVKLLNVDEKENQEILQQINDQIEGIRNQVEIWSKNKYVTPNKQVEKNQKIMKLKWKEHAEKVKQKILSKIAGKKKNDALFKKKQRIKGKQ